MESGNTRVAYGAQSMESSTQASRNRVAAIEELEDDKVAVMVADNDAGVCIGEDVGGGVLCATTARYENSPVAIAPIRVRIAATRVVSTFRGGGRL